MVVGIQVRGERRGLLDRLRAVAGSAAPQQRGGAFFLGRLERSAVDALFIGSGHQRPLAALF